MSSTGPIPTSARRRFEPPSWSWRRKLRGGLNLNASAYVNRLDNLISLQQDPVDGRFVYVNVDRNNSEGAEVGLDLKLNRGPSGRLGYAWQQSSDQATGQALTNSPRHMVKAALTWPLLDKRLTASLDGWYMSARRTLLGGQADSSIVANLTLRAPRIHERFDVSASVYNLFDEQYADPGSQGSRRTSFLQRRPQLRLKVVLPILRSEMRPETPRPLVGRLHGAARSPRRALDSSSERDPLAEYPVKAAFLYHFVEFVEWPRTRPLQRPPHYRGSRARPVRRSARQRDPQQDDGRTHAHHPALRHRRGPGAVRDPLHQLERDVPAAAVLVRLRGAAVLTVGEADRFAQRGGMIGFFSRTTACGWRSTAPPRRAPASASAPSCWPWRGW